MLFDVSYWKHNYRIRDGEQLRPTTRLPGKSLVESLGNALLIRLRMSQSR